MKRPIPRVVIVGGGFGGLYAAKALRKAPVDVVLIDRNNHHVFQPLLYQVATAGLSPGEIAVPIRGVLRGQRNARVLMANARGIDRERKVLLLDDGELEYDFMILAVGVKNNWFGNDAWAEHAVGLKTLEEAFNIRRRFLMAFEQAERSADPEEQRRLLTFAIIGGGPTGVELAGAMAEIAKHSIRKDFRGVDPRISRILLIEGSDRLLRSFDPELSAIAKRDLEELGVEILLNQRVTSIDERGVSLGDGSLIQTKAVFWGAGVGGRSFNRALAADLDRAGRVKIGPDLLLPGTDNIFVAGDMAACTDAEGKNVPGVAQGAIQMGEHAAAHIIASLRGEAPEPFRYNDKGSLATIGRKVGLAEIGKFKAGGLIGWLLWLFVHLIFLIGFKNRIFVLLQWIWSYLTWRRGARLITFARGELPHWDTTLTEDALTKARNHRGEGGE